MTDKPRLSIVPQTPPDARAALVERIKAAKKIDGTLQCSHCGGRQTMTIRSGDRIVGGRLKPGTVIERCICPHCWKNGVVIDLIPDKPREVKPSRPRRAKPKPVN